MTDDPLLATGDEPGPAWMARAPFRFGGEVVAYRVRTRKGAKPVVAHAAWRTSAEVAEEIVLGSTPLARWPEPMREARRLARALRDAKTSPQAAVTDATDSDWLQCAISGDTARLGGPMLKKIAFTAVALLAILAIAIATRPADYRVSRSQSIDALASGVYAQVADFHRWKAWSPWEKLDPLMQTEYAGEAGVPGASYAWKGNDKVGEGRMTLIDARPGQLLSIKLDRKSVV